MRATMKADPAPRRLVPGTKGRVPLGRRIARDFQQNYFKYIIILPVLAWLILFCYKPMYGVLIAFQDFRPRLGFAGSKWIGFDNFTRFFSDTYFPRVFRNTLTISISTILFSFPVPIILALLLNEVRATWFKRIVQTVTYLPHFIALVVVCAMVSQFVQTDGIINDIIALFGGERENLLAKQEAFIPIYVISGIWKEVGWNSIIYLAALSSIDQEQYEAARIDGAGRLQQMLHITLPGLLPTISLLLVMKLGTVMSVGYEKILLLYQPLTYEVADVISTYAYRKGILENSFSYGTAIDLFNSVVNIIVLTISNKLSKKVGQSGLF